MIRPIDFNALKGLLNCVQVAKHAGWRPTWSRPLIARGPCLFPGCLSKKNRQLAVMKDGWYCHKCHRHGDVIRLWAELHGFDMLQAALALCREFRIDPPRK